MRMPTGDNELAGWAAAGDAEAFRVLLERHYDGIFSLAFRFTRARADAEDARADAEDLAQDVCVRLADKIGTFRAEAKFSTWLYRLVVNAARDRARAHATRAKANADFADTQALRRADDADRDAQSAWVSQMLARFSDDIRETAVLVLGQQLSHGEAAGILGVKESTVSWRMHELRKGLKQMADEDR